MARAAPIQTSVNSGELSGRMIARVDFDRYASGATRAKNVVLLPTGGFTTRPGTRFINAIKAESDVGRVIPFKFSQADAVVIELAENAARFYRRQARLAAANIGASISNGTFASNITGWDDTSASGASIAHSATSGGRLALTPAGNAFARAEQDVTTTTTGVEHVLRFKTEGDHGARIKVGVGSSTGDDDLYEEAEIGMGWHTVAFTPSASPFYVWFKNELDDPAETVYIDDVEILDNVPLELTHDYSEAEIAQITYQQTGDVLYIFHPEKPTRKLVRFDTRSWSLVNVAWEDGPWGKINNGFNYLEKNLIRNPDFEDGIRYWTDESSDDAEIEWDAAQKIVIMRSGDGGGEDARIQQEIATGVSVSTEFVLHFRLLGSNVFATSMTVQVGTTSGGTDVMSAIGFEQGWHSVTFTTSAATIYLRIIKAQASGVIVAGGLGGAYLYRSNARLMEINGTEGSVTCEATGHAPFKSTDVGRLIRFAWPGKEPAWGIITTVTDADTAIVRLRRKAAYSGIPTEDWRLGEWGATNGYPTAANFFQQRAVIGGVAVKPNTIWLSQTGDIENFRPDSFISLVSEAQDDDAMAYTLVSDTADTIRWFASKRNLIAGTDGGHWVGSSEGAALTPDDVAFVKHTETPCAAARPIPAEDGVVYLEDGGNRLFDIGFRYEQETFITADVSILSEHVGRSPMAEAVHQKRPFSTIWIRREDGRLLPVAYNRQQDIIGWARGQLGGVFGSGSPVVESIAVIPGANDAAQALNSGERDELWLIVKRTIDGATHRYIEVMEGIFAGPLREDYATEALWEAAVKTAQADAVYLDSAVTYDGAATTTITGLSHLEGQSVKVLADGRIHPARTVASGQITLAYAASKVQAGLGYDWEVETLKLPYGTQSGSGVGKQKAISNIGLVLMDSGPVSFGVVTYDELEGRVVHEAIVKSFERSGLAFDEAIPLFTGEVSEAVTGADRGDARLLISGSSPLPVTVLAMLTEMEAAERAR